MSNLKLIIGSLVLLAAEAVYPEYLRISNVKPDLSLALVVFISLYFGARRGAAFGFFVGLLKDSFGASAFGKEALVLFLIGAASGRLNEIIYKESALAKLIIVILASAFVGITFARELGFAVILYILYTSCLAPFVFKFMKRAI